MDNTLLTADFVTKLCAAGPSYSYSTALPHLREPDRVEIFFELAQELAEPNSEEYANVVSNRSNALRQSGRGYDVISGLTLALTK